MERTLSRRLLGKRTASRELLAFLDERLPRLQRPSSAAAWKRRATKARAAVLELFLRGHPAGVLEEQPRVEWRGVIDAGPGYRIRKLRYEGYPGLWVPALLYEPTSLSGKVPAVLNPNGHHAGGKAMDYKQARCINLAKRGMLALNTEFIGMGELRSDSDHMRISLLDFCGVAGVGVFYLLMKRGLDVLLAHRHADPERVAMTGLSGGGWQTAVLSALDERVTVPVPVAGHSPVWQRCRCAADMGDLEQCPADLCTAADYDVLTGMFAPRPTLLIYNHEDDCCFQTRRTRLSVYRPARAVFETLGAAGDIELHDNLDPGTHNYESDNRGQLYRFLNKHWGLDTPDDDLPYEEELLPESELNVGLPADNATLYSLAQGHLQRIRRRREKARPAPAAVTRRRLARVLHLGRYEAEGALGRRGPRGGLATSDGALRVGPWSVPVTAVEPGGRAKGTEIVLSDGGRRGSAALAREALEERRRVLAVDLFGAGENACAFQFHMLLASAGERSLGIMAGQLLAVADWASRHYPGELRLRASGRTAPVLCLLAAALQPRRFSGIVTSGQIDSLERLVEWPSSYAADAPLLCFGLLEEIDLPDLVRLSAPVPLADSSRGPLR